MAAEVFAPLARADPRRWGACDRRGLMLDGKGKSIQPMAERLPDGNEQALQPFVGHSPGDRRPVRRRLATQMTAAVDPDAWVVEDTGFPEYGTASVGSPARPRAPGQGRYLSGRGEHPRRQRPGQLPDGRAAGAARELGPGPGAATRRAPARGVRHRPKWQLVLDMVDELGGWGLVPPVVVTDAG